MHLIYAFNMHIKSMFGYKLNSIFIRSMYLIYAFACRYSGSARVQAEERKQVRDKEVRDERGRRELQRTLSPPLFKLSFLIGLN